MIWLKRLFCRHNWVDGRIEYIQSWGMFVANQECSKCGKKSRQIVGL